MALAQVLVMRIPLPRSARSRLVGLVGVAPGLGCASIATETADAAPTGDAAPALPPYLAGCGSLFAARVTERMVISDQEDPTISGSTIPYADVATYRWPSPEVYRARVLAQSHDADLLWTTAAREDGAGQRGDAMFVLRKARRGAAPWEAAEHTHLGSTAKLAEAMTRCEADGTVVAQVPLAMMIDAWLRGAARDPFVVEDAAAWNHVDPYWVTGAGCVAPE